MQQDHPNKVLKIRGHFLGYGDVNRYKVLKIIGRGGFGIVFSAIDTHTNEKVAVKKITNAFSDVPRAVQTLREIRLLRLLRHPNIVGIKSIIIPPSSEDFADVYVVLELINSDLDNIIKVNVYLAPEQQRFIMFQILRTLKFMHAANVYHLDLKPCNILIHENFKLKVCDFGISRVCFSKFETSPEWRLIGHVGTGPYKAPEICGSRYSKYTYALDIWSAGCIFAEMLKKEQLFPGKNYKKQLDGITCLLGTQSAETIAGIHDDAVKRYLTSMPTKIPIPFAKAFPNADPLEIRLLQKLLAFDPKHRPTAEEALVDDYFKGMLETDNEPSLHPISRDEFAFENPDMTVMEIRKLMYSEILKCHQ